MVALVAIILCQPHHLFCTVASTSSLVLTSSLMTSQHCCVTTSVVTTAVISTVTEMTSSYAASNSSFPTPSNIHSTAVIHQGTASSTWLLQATATTSTSRVIDIFTISTSPTSMEQNSYIYSKSMDTRFEIKRIVTIADYSVMLPP